MRGDTMADENKRGKGNENSGMKFDQKMKSYLVLHWMKKNTDSYLEKLNKSKTVREKLLQVIFEHFTLKNGYFRHRSLPIGVGTF